MRAFTIVWPYGPRANTSSAPCASATGRLSACLDKTGEGELCKWMSSRPILIGSTETAASIGK